MGIISHPVSSAHKISNSENFQKMNHSREQLLAEMFATAVILTMNIKQWCGNAQVQGRSFCEIHLHSIF